jgi:hypothetical protein
MNRKDVVRIWGATNSRGRLVKDTITANRVDASNWALILDGKRVRVEVRIVGSDGPAPRSRSAPLGQRIGAR